MFVLHAFVGERRPESFHEILGYACEKRMHGISEEKRHYHEFVPHILQIMNQTNLVWNEVSGADIICSGHFISSLHFQGSTKQILCPTMCPVIANSLLVPCCASAGKDIRN
jgi:hypothetical protein